MQPRNREGFSLVELVVAMMVLTVGMLAMATSTGYVAARIRSSNWDTQRAIAREQIVEELRATPFANLASSTTNRTVGRFTMSWVMVSPPPNPNVRRMLVIARGPGYRPGTSMATVTDTFAIDIARP